MTDPDDRDKDASFSPDSNPTPDLDATIPDGPAGEKTKPAQPGIQTNYRDIGRYKILQKIGEGGMGVVFLAEQEKPIKRQVALKVIKSGANSKKVIARFESERQALALMDHQNIAKILDAGTTDDGLPFFAMELVNGIPLHRYCDQHRLSISQRLNLFIPVCKAVQHAHQKGIVHRDLKPSNVLIDHNQGKPIVKVIDFGLAKAVDHQTLLSDHSIQTDFGKVVGTVQYMSPEQAESGKSNIDTRTDVYSLGVMLYELLTGSIPLDAGTIGDKALLRVLEIIRDQEPPRPSLRLAESSDSISQISERRQIAPRQLENILKGDLDWVVMKAIDKDRERRYESAASFADDINRYLRSDVVVARPPSTSYRLKKFVDRNRLLVGTVAAIAMLMVGGAAGTSWFAYQAYLAAQSEKIQKEIAFDKSEEADKQRRAAVEAKLDAEASAMRSAEVLKIVTTSFRSTNPNEGANAKMTAREVLQNVVKTMEKSKLDGLGKADLLSTLSKSFYGLGEFKRAKSSAIEEISWREKAAEPNLDDIAVAKNSLALAHSALGENKESLLILEQLLKAAKAKPDATLLQIAEFENNLAVEYSNFGRLDDSIELHRKVMDLRIKELGIEHIDTIHSLANLANTLQKASRFDESKSLLEQATMQLKKTLADDHPNLLMAMGNLAIVYQLTGELDKSVAQHEYTLAKRKAKLGPEHPDTLLNMSNLGIALVSAGRPKDAIDLYQQALPSLNKSLGANHPTTLAVLNNLADSLLTIGKVKDAIPVFEQAVKAMTQIYGKEHPDSIFIIGNLARAYAMDGQNDKSAEQYENLLKDSDVLLGPKHQTTVITLSNLAVTYSNAGKVDKALSLTRKAYDATKQVMGPEHPLTLTNLNNLAMVLRAAGYLDEATMICRQAVELRTKKFGLDHPSSLEASANLALLYVETGKYDQAVPLLKSTTQRMKRILGDSHPTTLVVMGNLAVASQAIGQLEESIAIHRETSKILSEKSGPDHPSTLTVLNNLASALQAAGKLDEAGEVLLSVSKRFEKKLGAEHPLTLNSNQSVAYLYWQQKEFDKALEMAKANLESKIRVLGPDHPETRESEMTIGMILRDTGMLDEAISLLEKVARGPVHNKLRTIRKELREAYAKANQTEKLKALALDDLKIARENLPADSIALANALVLVGTELNKIGEFETSVEVLRETYEIRKRELPVLWVTANTQSVLGEAYLGQKKYELAQPLLEQGFEKLMKQNQQIPLIYRKVRLTEAIERLIKLAKETDDSESLSKLKKQRESIVNPK